MERMKASDFPPEVLKLFDGFVHGGITRREFLDRAAKYAVGTFSAAGPSRSLRISATSCSQRIFVTARNRSPAASGIVIARRWRSATSRTST